MKDLFVSYALAVALKEKGFDEPCFAWYDWVGKELFINDRSFQDINPTNAPLYQQVIDWFMVKHNRQVNYHPSNRDKTIREIEENLTLLKPIR